MSPTRRLMILGAGGLAGLAPAARARPERPTPARAIGEPLTLAALLASGRGALASSRRGG